MMVFISNKKLHVSAYSDHQPYSPLTPTLRSDHTKNPSPQHKTYPNTSNITDTQQYKKITNVTHYKYKRVSVTNSGQIHIARN